MSKKTSSLPWYAELLLQYRWLLVVPIVLPLSFLFDTIWSWREAYIRMAAKWGKTHEERVAEIKSQVEKWKKGDRKHPLCTARPGWLMVSMRGSSYKKKDNQITIPLYDILELNEVKRTVKVEPGVNMGVLSHYLVPRGWTLPIVPELDDLTAGGLLMGYGIETSSHKYGLFCDIVVSCDVLIGDGSVVHCSSSENSDLFYALPWSHGSLGFLMAMELKVIPGKPYVRLVYERVTNQQEMVKRFTELVTRENPPEFVEGMLFEEHYGALVYGDMTNHVDGHIYYMGRWYQEWFHRHALTLINKNYRTVEFVPTRDYYHRHTRGLYWEGELIVPFGNHWLFRLLLGWLMPPKVSFLKLTQGETIRNFYEEKHVAQDFLVPITELENGLIKCHQIYELYPLWLSGHKIYSTKPQGMVRAPPNGASEEMYVDIGLWYTPMKVFRKEPFDSHSATKEYEEFVRGIRGYQALYAVTEQSRSEFEKMFDCSNYYACRKKYHANGVFMDVYDKIKK